MLRLSTFIFIVFALCTSNHALAEDGSDEPVPSDDETTEAAANAVEGINPSEDDSLPDMVTTDDQGDPIGSSDDPTGIGEIEKPTMSSPSDVRSSTPRRRSSYPITKLDRPLVLPQGMAEVRLDVPVFVNPFQLSGALAAFYSPTDKLQLGFRYGLGTQNDDGFNAGKAGEIDARYSMFDWLAIQAAVPVNVDPFAMALTLGAPMQFSFFDTLRLEFGADLLSIKLAKFIPVLDNAAQNALLASSEINNVVSPRAQLNLILSAFYQLNERQVIEGRFGTVQYLGLPSGSSIEKPVQLSVGFMHSTSSKFDFGARTGFAKLDDPGDSFFLSLFAALRI